MYPLKIEKIRPLTILGLTHEVKNRTNLWFSAVMYEGGLILIPIKNDSKESIVLLLYCIFVEYNIINYSVWCAESVA